jgi:transcriptional regulator with XRE-family HTH domain
MADRSFRVYSPESFGLAIRHYREQAGLTQQELADLTGIDRTYLLRLERGTLQSEQLRRILRVLRQLGVRVVLQEADW